jgi:hypothetical protein
MAQNVIALISDCDGTICPDTATILVRELGLEPVGFWRDVNLDVQRGWDPPLAWLNHLITLSQKGAIPPLTRELLRRIGESIELYPGVADFVQRIRDRLLGGAEFRDAGVVLEWYIVSSGIEELIQAMPLGKLATEIYGCRLAYDDDGCVTAVKSSVTFTEKTKFIYAINKGIAAEELYRTPYRVNDAIDRADRRVPFPHMLYLGDGPSDIPCFSMVKSSGGHAIGVIPPDDSDLRKPFELATGQRLTVGPYGADYRDGSDLFRMLTRIVESIGDDIVVERAQQLRSGPRY